MWETIKGSFAGAVVLGVIIAIVSFVANVFGTNDVGPIAQSAGHALGTGLFEGCGMGLVLFVFGLFCWKKSEAVFGSQAGALGFIALFGFKSVGYSVLVYPANTAIQMVMVFWPFVVPVFVLLSVVSLFSLWARQQPVGAKPEASANSDHLT